MKRRRPRSSSLVKVSGIASEMQRPMPDDVLRIVMRGAEKEDKIAG
jgi:hypothetical protein